RGAAGPWIHQLRSVHRLRGARTGLRRPGARDGSGSVAGRLMAARTRRLDGSPLGLLGRRAQAVLAPSEAFRPGRVQASGRSRIGDRVQEVSLAQMGGWLLGAIASLCAL